MGIRVKFFSAVAVLAYGTAAIAHHAFTPVYDGGQTISVSGTVIEFHLVNPHATMLLVRENADGSAETWTVEFDGLLNLTVAGWTEDIISAGERVTVEGNPTHTGSARMFFTRLVRADGTELLRPLLERANAIDELRRQRTRTRYSQD